MKRNLSAYSHIIFCYNTRIHRKSKAFLTKVSEKFLTTSVRCASRRRHTRSFSSSDRRIGFTSWLCLFNGQVEDSTAGDFFSPRQRFFNSQPSVTTRDRELVSVQEVRIEPRDLNPRPLTPQSCTLLETTDSSVRHSTNSTLGWVLYFCFLNWYDRMKTSHQICNYSILDS